MAGSTFDDYGAGGSSSLIEGMSSDQRCQSGESLAEWRSCEQVENGTPSTSPPFWDTDDDDDDNAPKPSELHGKHTWQIEKFSEINKRELRSSAFEVGGYKWYILIYPQGCDVSNHLSLFLCVANHDKLLPGWSHFAQFTIAVVNKDPKKSKHSDTLHRFWKKEHDWGWKKFMELSKVSDGFIVEDTLVIKAQVQVIREKAHRPFRCLDRQYRRELVRVYLSNVEQICRRSVEERRGKLSKLIEDRIRWSSFRVFWLGIDQNARRRMSRDKADAILKVVVKHFFIEKEVTSTLVMDSLHSGLKALEYQSKNKDGKEKLADVEELPAPMVRIEKDMFVLADDVLLLLERAVLEPLPHQPLPPKDDKASQNRTKDGISGEELNKDFIERDERRLTELGRRTVEIFVLAHIFSRIEVAYQEAVALKRQEELIREEEAAGLVENELKSKRGAAEKEKRTKKKQTKQKRNGRKGKDRGRDEKSDAMMQDKHQPESPSDGRILEFSSTQAQSVIEKIGTLEDASDVSDTGDDVPEVLQPESEDRDASSVNWDTDTPEIHPAVEARGSEIQIGQIEKMSQSIIDDSCSTCSTDSVPSVVINGPYKGNSLPNNKCRTSPIRGKDQRSKDTHDRNGFTHDGSNPPSDATTNAALLCDDSASSKATQPEPESVASFLNDRIRRTKQHLVDKEEVIPLQKKLNITDQVEVERSSKSRTTETSSSPCSPGKKPPLASQQSNRSSEIITAKSSEITTTTAKSSEISTTTATPISVKEPPPSNSPAQAEKLVPLTIRSPQISSTPKSEAQKSTTPAKSTATHQVPAMSRPLSAPLIPLSRPTVPIVSTVQTMPLLSRSISAAGRLGTDPSPSAPSYHPQSYRNAIIGRTTMGASPAGFSPLTYSSNQSVAHSQPPSAFVSSGSMLPPQTSARNDQTSLRPGFTFGSIKPGALHSQHTWRDDYSHQEASSSSQPYSSNVASEINMRHIYGKSRAKQYSGEVSSSVTSGPSQGTVLDGFPHLGIIDDLLNEDLVGKAASGHHHPFSRQYTFPRDVATTDIGSYGAPCRIERSEQYYNEGFQRGVYGSSDGPLHAMRDTHVQQMDLAAYADAQIDGSTQNQWPYHHADPSMMNSGVVDPDGYPYQLPEEYLNSMYASNGYNMYRPTSGH